MEELNFAEDHIIKYVYKYLLLNFNENNTFRQIRGNS